MDSSQIYDEIVTDELTTTDKLLTSIAEKTVNYKSDTAKKKTKHLFIPLNNIKTIYYGLGNAVIRTETERNITKLADKVIKIFLGQRN